MDLRVSVSEKKAEGLFVDRTSGKSVYIDFINQSWRKIVLHLIKTDIFRMKLSLTRDPWLNSSKEPRIDIF